MMRRKMTMLLLLMNRRLFLKEEREQSQWWVGSHDDIMSSTVEDVSNTDLLLGMHSKEELSKEKIDTIKGIFEKSLETLSSQTQLRVSELLNNDSVVHMLAEEIAESTSTTVNEVETVIGYGG
mmetsp:Transcript_5735/g.9940  ORF Transcript_5735/g.9940 Transcript_5735/m.9940 type:complete len:123 (-) Transcript_5735:327-695(-)